MSMEDSRVLSAEVDAEALHLEMTEPDAQVVVPDILLAQATELPKTSRLAEEEASNRLRAENGVVELPAGVSVDDMRVEGNDLVLVQLDGTEIIIVDGALRIPTIVLGDVELSEQVLLAALEDSGINVAAGPDGSYSATGTPPSSGAEFETIEQRQAEDVALAELLGDTTFSDESALGDNGVDDGAPSIQFPLSQPFLLEEAVLADGTPDNQTISGRLPFEQGPDYGTISRVAFAGASNVDEEGAGAQMLAGFTSGGSPITVTSFEAPSGGSLGFLALEGRDAGGALVFQLTINNRVTGDFTFELIGRLDHPDVGQNGLNDLLRLGFSYTVTDLDGDFVTGTLNIDVLDDTPVAKVTVNAATTLDDEAQMLFAGNAGGTGDVGNAKIATGEASSLFTAGADGVKSVSIDGGAFSVIYKTTAGLALVESVTWGSGVAGAGGVTTFTAKGSTSGQDAAVLKINADGSYSFELKAPVAHQTAGTTEENRTISIGFTVTDGDGDKASGTLNVSVNDDTPVAKNVVAARELDDEAQSEFTPTNPGSNLPFDLTDPNPNYKSVSGNAGALFTAGADGVKSVSIDGPEFTVVYKDALGFARTEVVGWGSGVVGPDGATTFTATSTNYPLSEGGAAVLVIKADGSYTFTLNAPLAHSEVSSLVEENETLSFSFTVTDGDNDTATGSLKVSVDDDTPEPVVSIVTAQTLDDEAQTLFTPVNLGGSFDTSPDVKSVSGGAGTLFRMGADGLKALAVDLPDFSVIAKTANGFATTEAVSWGEGVRSAGGVTTYTATSASYAGGAAVLVIRADGSYTFTLNAPIAHGPSIIGENNEGLVFGYKVTDGDGDQAVGALGISIDDDTPVAKVTVNAATTLDDEAQMLFAGNAGGTGDVGNAKIATGEASSLFTAGADGVKSVSIDGGAFSVIYKTTAGLALVESVTWGSGVAGAGGVTTFTAKGSTSGQDAAVLKINADGSYSFELKAPVAHQTAGTTEENRTISIGFTVTDGDGDKASGTLNVSVNDDTPVAKNVVAARELDDEAQSEFTPTNPGSNLPFDLTDPNPNYKSVSGNAGALFTAGADGVKSVSIDGPEFTVVYKDALGFARTEVVGWGSGVVGPDGATTFTATSTNYPLSEGGAAVLVIKADGSYTFTLNAPLAHSEVSSLVEENETLSFSFTVTDGDNDTATGSLKVSVDDDTPEPVVSIVTAQTLDDEAQTLFTPVNLGGSFDTSPDVKSVSGGAGTLFRMGADGLKALAVDLPDFSVIAKTANGFATTEAVSWGEGVRSAGGVTTYTATSASYAGGAAVLVIRADGSYTFTLNAPIAHGPSIIGENNEGLVFGYKVTDGDGDQAVGALGISIDDDTPVAKVTVNAATTLDDEAQMLFAGNAGGTGDVGNAKIATGEASSLFTAGADGVKSVSIDGGAFSVIYKTTAGLALVESVTWGSGVAGAGGVTTFTAKGSTSGQDAAVLKINADGSYSFELKAPVAHQTAGTTEENRTISIGFTVTDGDGDKASGTLNVSVNDDTPVAKNVVAARELDDEAQSEFTPTNPGSNLPFDLTDPNPNYKSVSGNAGALFTAGADGVKSVSIDGPEFTVVYKDALGFARTEVVGWGSGVVGPDGATTFTATSTNYPLSEGGAAVLVIKADGSYTFTLNAPLAHSEVSSLVEENETLSFSFTVTDGDNDTATGSLKVSVDDDTPEPVVSIVTAQTLDDEAQTLFTPVNLGGSFDTSPDVKSVSGGAGTLFRMGADGLKALAVDLPDFSVIAKTANGFATTEAVSWGEGVRSAGGVTTYTATSASYAGGAAVLVIRADGSYTFTLNAPIAHGPSIIGENNEGLVFGYKVTDGDGDQAVGALGISIDDDTPVAKVTVNAATTLDDEAQMLFAGNAGGTGDVGNAKIATGEASSLFTAGADGVKSVSIDGGAFSVIYKTTAGLALVESVTWGSGVAGAGGVTTFTAKGSTSGQDAAVLKINADGSYSFELKAPVAHQTAGTTEENRTISIGFTVTDGDGDKASGTLNVSVNDDTPVAKNVVAARELDDEAQSEFTPTNPGSNLPFDLTDPNPNYKSVSGNAGALFTAGADGVKSVSIDGPEFTVVYKDALGFARTEVVGWGSGVVGPDGATTFTATSTNYPLSEGGAAVLVIKADGSYTFTLNAPLAHSEVSSLVEENETLSFSFTVTDGDNDTATGSLKVSVDDDTPEPVVSIVTAQTLDDEAQTLFTPVNLGGSFDTSPDVKSVSGGAGTLFRMGADGLKALAVDLPDFSVIAKTANGFATTEAVSWGEGVRSAGGVTTYTATSASYAGGAAVLVIRADGSYTFTLNAPIAHGPSIIGENNEGLVFGYKVTDGDGDQAVGALGISIDDDTPVAKVTVNAATTLDDEAQMLFAGNAGGTGDVGNAKIATGEASSLFTAGADGVKSVSIDGGAFSVIYKTTAGLALVESVTWGSGVAGAGGVTTFTAKGSTSGQDAAVLKINADGSYSFELKAPVAHQTAGTTEENRTISIGFTVTDGDGDKASGTLNVSVNDDTPVAKNVVAARELDDEAQSEFTPTNPGSNLPFDLTDPNPNYKSVSGNAGALFTAGADGVKSVSIDGPEFTVVYKDALGFARTEVVGWGSGVVGPDGATTFTATSTNYPLSEGGAAVLVIKADGSYTFTLNAPLAHSEVSSLVEENETLSFSFTVTDGDNDTATGSLKVSVDDDTPEPVVSIVTAQTLDDEAQTLFTPVNLGGSFDTSPDVKSVSGGAGTLFRMGADGLKALAVDLPDFSVIAKTANGFATTEAVSWGEGVRSAGGVTTYTATSASYAGGAAVLVIRADGSYTFTLNAPIAHGPSIIGENNEGLVFGYKVTDGDGDQAVGALGISIDDDTPVAKVTVNAATTLDDEAQMLFAGNAGGTGDVGNAKIATGEASSLFTAGADGVKSVSIDGGAFSVIYKTTAGLALVESVTWGSGVAGAGGVTTFTAKGSTSGQDAAVLKINADGSYSFELKAPVAHQTAGTTEENRTISIGFTVTDGDGDKASGTLNVSVNDDTPVAKNVVAARELDDEAQSEFTPTNPGSNLPFDLTDPNPNYKSVSGNAGALFTAGADGVKSVSIDGPEFTVVYKDALGFARTEVVGWGSGVVGPDGATTFTATSTNYPLSEGGAAVLVIKADGSYTFTLNAPLAHSEVSSLVEENETLSFSFTVTDGDNDTATGSLKVSVDDDTPEPVVSIVTAQTLDDEAQTLFTPVNLGGSFDTSPDVKSVSGGAGTLFRMGADGLKALAVDLPDFSVIAKTANGFATTEAVSWGEGVRSAGGVTTYTATSASYAGGAAVLVIRADGSYTFTLNAPIAHGPSIIGENNEGLVFGYKVTDGDGDQAVGALGISIDDDTPVAKVTVNAATTLDDEAQMLFAGNAGGTGDVGNAKIATGEASSLFTAGADGVKSVSIDGGAFSVIYKTTAGLALVESVTWGSGVAGAGGVTTFTAKGSTSGQDAAVLKINADGSYSFELKAPVAHQTAGTTEENRTISIGFTVTDGDGDKASGTLNVSVNDDTPTGGAGTTAWLNDDTLSGGNPGGEGDHGLANTTNVLKHSFGADGPGGIAWTGISVTGGGNQADFASSVSADGKIMQVYQGNTLVITAVLNPLNGQYTLTQNAPIDHVKGGDENEVQFQFNYDVTDGDGDVAPGYIWVNVDDDTPTGGAGTTAWLNDDTLSGGNPGGEGDHGLANTTNVLKHSFGADGPGGIVWTGISVTGGGNQADFASSVSADGKIMQVYQGNTLVITAVLNPLNGQYTLTQNAPIDHVKGGDENEVQFQFNYDVTDGDGDVAPGYIWVNVDDDTPTGGAGTTAWLNDDTLSGGNPGGEGDHGLANTTNVLKHSFGADGPGGIVWTGISVTGGGNQADFASSVSADGKIMQVYQGNTLVITAVLNPLNGQYTLTQNAPIDHVKGGDENEVQFQFNYDVTDGDGDVAPGYIWVNVDDDTPTGGAGTTAWLNDDTLSGGNPGGEGDHGLANTTNVLKHSFGADGPGGIVWTGISVTGGGNQADFASSVSADGKIMQVYQGNTLVITAVLNPLNGQYTLTQNAPIDHVKGGDENEVQFQFNYDVTDGDGDVAPGYIWVNVDDDTPMAKGLAEVGSLSETGLPTVSFDFGDLNVSVGADKKGTHVEIGTLNGQPIINSNLTSDGVPLEYIVRTTNGVDQELVAFKAGSTADNPVFIVAVLHPGSFATTLFQNLDHLGSNDDVLALNLVARVFDGDGDYVDQPFTINVNDSEPAAIDLTSVMDENQSIEIALTDGTHFSFGADTTGTALSIGAVTLSDGPSGVTLGTPSVTFDPSTNKISIVPGTAFDALAAGQTVVLHIPYTVKDGDDDTITKDIAVTVTGTNDAPVITVASGDSAGAELHETNAGLTATGALTVTDADVTDVVTAAVTFLEVSGPDYGTNLTHQELNSYFKVTPGTVLDGSQTSGSLTWKFDSENQAFDFLAANTRLVLKYTITVTDSSGATSTQIVEIGINGTNDLPTISASVPVHLVEEGYQQAGVASSSATLTLDDVDGTASYDANALSTGGWTAGNDGTWTKTGAYGVATLSAGTNTITYVLNNSLANSLGVNDHPQETFTVPVHDNKGAVASVNVSFIIDGTNDAPVVSGAVTGTVTEGGVSSTLNALANATDPEGSALSVINIAALPAGVTYDVATKSFTLDPTHSAYASLAAGVQTTVTVSYQVSDGAAATPAEVSWVVTGIANNAAPTVVGETIYINSYDTKIPDWVLLLNDSDPNAGDILSVSAVPGSAALFDSVNDTGTTTTYTDSSTLFFGAGPGGSFQYTVSDGNGGTSSPATASLTRVFGSTIETGNGDSIAVGGDWDDTIKGGNGKDVLVGGAGNDTLNGGNASDILYGGLGADLLIGGNGSDTFNFDAGDSGATSLSLGTIFSAGSVSGYDTVVDFKNIDKLDLPVIPIVAANTVGRVNGADAVGSTGFLSSPVTVSYHSITNGVITFYSASSGGLISINSNATLAAVAKYLQSNDLGEAGTTVAFKTDFLEGNADDTFIYQQVGATPDPQRDILIGLADVTISDLDTLVANGEVDPIILDLDKNGFSFSSIDNGVTFDIDADGHKDQIGWTSDDGILAYDVDGNGLIDNGSEIFTPDFNGGKFASGVAALASLDSNGDGKIDANDDAFSKLQVWIDADNDGVSDQGELSSLFDHGVTSISLTTHQTGGLEGGQTIFAEGEFTFADGSTGNFVEVGLDTIFGSDSTVIGTEGDDILHGGMGRVMMTGGAGADTFVFDETALSDLDVADVITDFNSDEGDVLDVTSLLDTLLGEDASAEMAMSSIRVTADANDTTVSVEITHDSWKDVAVLQNHTEAVKILFKDEHHDVQVS